MNLKHLESFVRVAELGSFSKAARLLDVAQPALSRQVRQLETELRETLLLRNGRGVSLTGAGKRLFDHGVQILQRVALAGEDLGAQRDTAVGHVTIGMPPSIGRQLTLPLIEGFRQRMPKARLTIVEGLSANIVEWIASGRADIGLLYSPDAQPALEITPLLSERLCLVQAVAKGRRPSRQGVALRVLPQYPLILPERHQAIRRLLETQAVRSGVKLHIAWEVSSIPAIIDLVCAGTGCAVLNASAVEASGRQAELAVRPITQPELTSVLCLAQSAPKPTTPLARQSAALLAELVQRRPAPGRTVKPRRRPAGAR
jgi:LysR family nitrogen assimilation transcriptional regulator